MFGRDLDYVSFLGMPSEKNPWMLQFGGHHLALNGCGREYLRHPSRPGLILVRSLKLRLAARGLANLSLTRVISPL